MEKKKSPSESPDRQDPKTPMRASPNIWVLVLVFIALVILLFTTQQESRSTISEPFFFAQVEKGNVQELGIGELQATGQFKKAPDAPPTLNDGVYKQEKDKDGNPTKLRKHFRVNLTSGDAAREKLRDFLQKHEVDYRVLPPSDSAWFFTMLVGVVLPIGLIAFIWIMFRRTQSQIMGGGFLSGFSKSPAKEYESDKEPVTFKDVAGLKSVKADLQEIIDFLSDPEKFQRLGGRVPKGVLLIGPPGTGKTLLARAVAGEAGVPFFSVNGSEFIQMFVGVGASRVRDLFKNAKDSAPAIIFVDEIDAVGRQRGAGLGGGHDEREQTLNQILSEMDGFAQNDSVIVLAATNRPDVLDPALLRPGRFDRHVTVNRPTHQGRLEIFKVHVREVPLADDVDLDRLASATMGLTGADIRNLVNEAALWATRHDKDKVYMEDFEYARDRVLMGAKREELITDKEKEKTAYHEAGHALVAWLLPGADRVHKVTIIPRGQALGVTQMLPEEDRLSIAEHELYARLAFMLGGRAAERLIYHQNSAGAENDLEQATNLARRMVTQWGMSERLGPVCYKLSDEDPFLGREMHAHRAFSEHTMQIIDDEVARILHASAKQAEEMLDSNRDKLEKITQALLKEEEIDEQDIINLIGPAARSAESNGAANRTHQTPAAKAEDKVT